MYQTIQCLKNLDDSMNDKIIININDNPQASHVEKTKKNEMRKWDSTFYLLHPLTDSEKIKKQIFKLMMFLSL